MRLSVCFPTGEQAKHTRSMRQPLVVQTREWNTRLCQCLGLTETTDHTGAFFRRRDRGHRTHRCSKNKHHHPSHHHPQHPRPSSSSSPPHHQNTNIGIIIIIIFIVVIVIISHCHCTPRLLHPCSLAAIPWCSFAYRPYFTPACLRCLLALPMRTNHTSHMLARCDPVMF